MARLRELLLPLVFSIFQIIYTWYGFERLQYEELAESIRAPVLLASHTIYDGISSNVGWYALCAIFYKTFGFNPFAVKVARLVLHFVGLFILARFFQKKLPIQKACILLCLISLSPTLLYFNTYQASYGSDLQFLPLVWILCFSQKQITRFVGGLVFCVATLSYPPVLFFAVPLSIIKISRGEFHYEILLAYLFMFLGFVLFLHDPMRWIWDPTVQAGVLRGGGGSIHIHMGVWSQNFKRLLVDLFVTGKSYAFSIPGTEFSGALGILGFIGISTIFFTRLKDILKSINRYYFWGALLFLLVTITVPLLSTHEPGLRRSLGVLVIFYSLAFFTLKHTKWIGMAPVIMLIAHHIGVLPANIALLKDHASTIWDPVIGSTHNIVKRLESKTPFICPQIPCRMTEADALTQAWLHWGNPNLKK